ncbi:MAG: transglutaminase [Verrucomicrobiales bacterium VVV1]|nr:MAG: transglutaminase [Verrucomicrobiales bacterium VVV1]
MRFVCLLSCLWMPLAFAGPREDLKASTLRLVAADQQKAAGFLTDHLPERDVTKVTPEYLARNVALAVQARNEFPWGKEIPDELFLNDVLPYATLDESRDDWRAGFLERFRKQVEGCKTASEAAVKLTAGIEKELGVKYSTKRRAANQGPAESIELKMASCSGLSILLVDALRSVCIPARIVGTAMWTSMEGNHNWIEVWLPETKSWQFTEYNPDKSGFDHGWLLPYAAQAIKGSVVHGIYASSWKRTDHHFPMIWDLKDTSVPGVEVTGRYLALGAKTLPAPGECELRVEVTSDGKRQPVELKVMQGDVVTATGKSPSLTDDANRYFTVKVKRGQLYQIYASGASVVPLEIGTKEETKRVSIPLRKETP